MHRILQQPILPLRQSSADPSLPRCCNLGRSRDRWSTQFGKVACLEPAKVFLLVYDPQLLLSCQGRFYQAVSDGGVGASRDLLNLVEYGNPLVCNFGHLWMKAVLSSGCLQRCVDRYKEWRLLCTQQMINLYGGFHEWGYPKMDGL